MPRGTPTTITADGVVGVSGKPVIVHAVAVGSGGTASVLALHNGTAASALMAQITGTISTKVLAANIPAGGLYFPAGLYADVDANIDGTNGHTIWIEQVGV